MSELLTLTVLPDVYAVCRYPSSAPFPPWIDEAAGFVSVTRTPDELSVVAPSHRVPDGTECESDWRVFRVEGPLPFDMIGVISRITDVLARHEISVFVISTYDTDYLLVKGDTLERAREALRGFFSVV